MQTDIATMPDRRYRIHRNTSTIYRRIYTGDSIFTFLFISLFRKFERLASRLNRLLFAEVSNFLFTNGNNSKTTNAYCWKSKIHFESNEFKSFLCWKSFALQRKEASCFSLICIQIRDDQVARMKGEKFGKIKTLDIG